MPELNPCPFCKTEGRPKLIYGFATVHNSADPQHPIRKNRYHVFCQDCRAVGPEHETADEAIKAWNTRYEPTCNWNHVKSGPLYDVWKCNSCGYEYSESKTDGGTQNEDFIYCPKCCGLIHWGEAQ